MAGMGVIARDHDLKILWVQTNYRKDLFCASEAEGQALLLGMEIADKLGVDQALFEVDSLEVYRAVTVGPTIEEWCGSWLHRAFNFLGAKVKWKISLVNRDANEVADCLARKARREGWRWESLNAIPVYVFLSHC
ncbi:hypothetical protein QQ045_019361 [Rhodiola kirilowii]